MICNQCDHQSHVWLKMKVIRRRDVNLGRTTFENIPGAVKMLWEQGTEMVALLKWPLMFCLKKAITQIHERMVNEEVLPVTQEWRDGSVNLREGVV